MIAAFRQLGYRTLQLTAGLGRGALLFVRLVWRKPRLRRALPLLMEQVYFTGVLSCSIVALSGLFIGMVVALQGYNTLIRFSAEGQLGQLVALSIIRELGPVVTALLFAGRAGSALAAEIGLMKATEQLASLNMMGVNPEAYVLAPRFWAGALAHPLLATLFSTVAILGGYGVAVWWCGLDGGVFWNGMQDAVSFRGDVLSGLIKSILFGIVITHIAVFHGYDCTPTAGGMAKATTQTVVQSSLTVLGLDVILTAFMMGGW